MYARHPFLPLISLHYFTFDGMPLFLALAQVLLKSPNTPRVEDTDRFQLNAAFASKLFKTKIPLIKTGVHVKQEETDRDAEMEMQRKHQVCVW